MRTMLWLRLLLIALGGALGVALIAHGNVVIGALLCALAVVRLVTVLHRRRLMRRRRVLIARRVARRGVERRT
jgi:hypothetical protein